VTNRDRELFFPGGFDTIARDHLGIDDRDRVMVLSQLLCRRASGEGRTQAQASQPAERMPPRANIATLAVHEKLLGGPRGMVQHDRIKIIGVNYVHSLDDLI
jgi:hypothetical protein